MAGAAVGILIVLAAVFFITSVVGPIFALVIKVLTWILVGYLAGKLIRGRGYGPVGDGLLGLGGGIVGTLVFGLLGFSSGIPFWGLITSVAGAVVLVMLVRLVADSNFAR